MSVKAKYWVAVLYPESMIDNWEEELEYKIQVPYSYCIHDKDKDGHDGDRKTHVHLLIAFPNTTTEKHALNTFQKIQENCVYCEAVLNVRYMYNYLIHDTENCRKKKKHLYLPEERKESANFDIGAYEQLTLKEKHLMLKNLCDFVRDYHIENFMDLYEKYEGNLGSEYFEILASYSGLLERLCKGNYHRMRG